MGGCYACLGKWSTGASEGNGDMMRAGCRTTAVPRFYQKGERMFRAIVEGGFSATHQVRLRGGALEPIHGHDWRVRLHLATSELDEQDMVVDFLHAQDVLRSILDRLHHKNLASCTGLKGSNPTAERVAEYVYEQVEAGGLPMITAVEVTEAPGCVAVYSPGGAGAGDLASIDPRDGHS